MLSAVFEDVRVCLRFYSRLPTPLASVNDAVPDFSRVSWAAPFAGAIIGAFASCALLFASLAGLPSPVAAVVTIGVLIAITGALHEDGLADFSDSFGGFTRDQKLAIMRDSRVGSFGVLALVFTVLLRVAAVFAALSHGAGLAALILIASSALSRAFGLMPLAMLPPARPDGSGASVVGPTIATLRRSLVIGVVFGLAPVLGGVSVAQTVLAILVAFGGAIGMARLAQRQIGGYTGDVLGASQQAAEIGALICLSA